MSKLLREKIYLKIRDDITLGKLRPGERLVEERLVKEFKSSRTPIREALRQLESESLIVFERNKGITISSLSIKQVDEIYNLRLLLEGYAARLFAIRATPRQLISLKKLQKNLEQAYKASDLKKWIRHNRLFHNFITNHSGNGNLSITLEMLKRRVYRYSYVGATIPTKLGVYNEQHENILLSCEKKDGALAEKHMKIHIGTVRKVLTEILKEFPSLT